MGKIIGPFESAVKSFFPFIRHVPFASGFFIHHVAHAKYRTPCGKRIRRNF